MHHFHSLKTRLILAFVGLLIPVTFVIVILSYVASGRALTDMGDNLLVEKAERISLVVARHMYGSAAVLETAFPTGILAEDDISDMLKELQVRFWAATTLYTKPNDYVYYGNIQGQNFAIKRLSPTNVNVRIRLNEQENRKLYQLSDVNQQPQYQLTETETFDPRDRPWFTLAKEVDSHTWTAVYVDFASKDLVVTRAKRVLDNEHEFAGVVATDVSLSQLNQFISTLSVTDNSRILILEPNGKIIAASYTDNLKQQPQGLPSRVSILDNTDQLMAPALQALKSENWTQLSGLGPQRMLGSNQEPIRVIYKHMTDDAGLDWMAVMAVPEKDLTAPLRQTLSVVIFIGVLAVLMAIILGIWIFGRIGLRVQQLSVAMRHFALGQTVQLPSCEQEDEIGLLVQGFNMMQKELLTDRLTGIGNRMALERVMGHYLTEASSKEPQGDIQSQQKDGPFSVLFVDLNRFKPLNDTYGHDNGDQALKEISQRLKNNLSARDHISRLGGDEFVIVIADCDLKQAVRHKESILQLVRTPLTQLKNIPQNVSVTLDAAVGIAVYPEDGADISTLLKKSDRNMYLDKSKSSR